MYSLEVLSCVFLSFFLSIEGIQIIWDNDAKVNYNDIDFARKEEVRMPNWLFIYPGTKWCGAGNVAMNFDDLGDFARTDKCCRAHDNCDDSIEGYQTNHNLTNTGFYSKLSCGCDEKFFQCLKSVNTRDSKIIGGIYFNALGTQCFKSDYPIKKCTKQVYFPSKKCVKYELDVTQEKVYQWFDIPIF
ncbi:PREDICTED: phospholipase A2-like [Nicrophorus vespilloides]|uniref:phospholipase A2 n=1 Tax=Nicrophorus vespilloides TaxID=110193 RepID=A0ABM1NDI0_NICVS|nr:PREDICTED: phospholipase A2-like [Nicrophorus vespilloides]